MSVHATPDIPNGWWSYFNQLADQRKLSPISLARRAGLNPSLLTRWKAGSQPSVENLRKLSHVTDVPVIRLLVEAGHLDSEEISGSLVVVDGIDEAPDARTAIEQDDLLSAATKRRLLAILEVDQMSGE